MNAMRNQRIMELHKQGWNYSQIARELGIGRMAVRYAVDGGYREHVKQRDRAKKRPRDVVTGEVYDGGDPWIEDRSVWPTGPSVRNGYKCAGKGGNQQPKPERCKSKPVTRLSALHAYLDGDRDALRVYLDGVG